MGAFADYLENEILDHIFGVGSWSAPATVYVGLSTTTITDAGGNITEPSGNAYAMVTVTNSGTNWNTAASGIVTNKTAITFPEATGSWGTVTDFFIKDGSSNVLVYGALTASKAIGTGDTASFAIGDLSISLD